MIKGSRDERCICTSGRTRWKDKISALQAFLLYFLDCKKELSSKLKEIRRPAQVPPVSAIVPKKKDTMPFSKIQDEFKTLRKKRLTSQSSSVERVLSSNLIHLKPEDKDNHDLDKKSMGRFNIDFGDTYQSLIARDDFDLDNEKNVSLLLLLNMMCEIFIFHSLLILQKEDEKCEDLYRNEFFLLVKKENSLPVDFCTDLLIKHKLHSDACKFLFIKNDYERLMEYIQDFYETSDDPKWLQKYAKYIKKIRQMNANNLRYAHNFILKYIPWLFDK